MMSFVFLVVLATTTIASAFQSVAPLPQCAPVRHHHSLSRMEPTTTQLNLFGFISETKPSAGKDGKPKQRVVTINGKPVPSAKTGQKILAVARKARVDIPTYCERGACGTCCCYLNGRKVHACMEKIPAGRAEIQTM